MTSDIGASESGGEYKCEINKFNKLIFAVKTQI